jgi:hypothetical protein
VATKDQYEFFKFLFENEEKRSTSLIDRGKTFISLIALYSGFIALSADEKIGDAVLLWILFASAALSMLMSLLLSIVAVGVFRYEKINSPENIISSFGDVSPSDPEFFDDRIIDLTVACNRNSKRNDQRAKLLFWASFFILLGLSLHASYFLLRGSPLSRDGGRGNDTFIVKEL